MSLRLATNESEAKEEWIWWSSSSRGFAIAPGLELSWRPPASCLSGRERVLWPLYILLPRARWDVSHHLPRSAELLRGVRRIPAASEAHCGRGPGGAPLDFPLTSCLRYFHSLSPSGLIDVGNRIRTSAFSSQLAIVVGPSASLGFRITLSF